MSYFPNDSIGAVGATGSAIPASATFMGYQGPTGTFIGISSNNPIPVAGVTGSVIGVTGAVGITGPDRFSSGNISANGQSVFISTQGAGTLYFNVTGVWSGTLQPQVQMPDGSWVNSNVFPSLPGGISQSTITANGQFESLCAAQSGFRILSTAWTSGAAVISLEVGQASLAMIVRQATAANLNATVVGVGATGTPSGGILTVQGTTGGTNVPVSISGNVGGILDGPSGATAPTNALLIGGIVATSFPTGGTGSALVGIEVDKAGRQTVILNTVRQLLGTWSTQSVSSVAGTMIPAGQAGIFNDICELILTNESSTATIVSISDGTLTYKFALAGNGGLTKTFATPLIQLGSATAWTVSNSASVNVDTMGVFAKNK